MGKKPSTGIGLFYRDASVGKPGVPAHPFRGEKGYIMFNNEAASMRGYPRIPEDAEAGVEEQ